MYSFTYTAFKNLVQFITEVEPAKNAPDRKVYLNGKRREFQQRIKEVEFIYAASLRYPTIQIHENTINSIYKMYEDLPAEQFEKFHDVLLGGAK